MKRTIFYYCALLSIGSISFHAHADNRCEADQLNAVGIYCKAVLDCNANHNSHMTKCLNQAEKAFARRYFKAQQAAFLRGYDCAYNADINSANILFFNESSALAQDYLLGWEPLAKKNRWYKSLLNSAATQCRNTLNIEATFARNNDEQKRQAAITKLQSNLKDRLDKLIARTNFAYSGLNSTELLASLSLFSDHAVTYIRPQLHGTFSLTALAVLADSSFIDSDTNNTDVHPISNNGFDNAQPVIVPAIVGGYVNSVQAGSAGNSYLAGDEWDVYRVTMTANQVISLSIGNTSADLDLYLYDLNHTEVASSTGFSAFESISTTTPGDYYVAVHAFSDTAVTPAIKSASNYSLSFGQQGTTQNSPGKAEFVPGEIIVRMKDQVQPAVATATNRSVQAQQMATGYGMSSLRGASDRDMLWKLSDDAGERQRSLQAIGAKPKSQPPGSRRQALATQPNLADDTLQAIEALRKRSDVASADLNYIRKPSTIPNDLYYSRQWDFPMISLPAAWDVTTGLNSIVAVIDTGVLLDHPDLQGQLLPGFDFISNPNNANDGDGIDANPNDPGDNPGGSHSFHGTHVSGTIAAASNNAQGVAGIAWNAKVMPLRALGVYGGTDYDISQAVRYASGLSNDSGSVPLRRADVINLSLGGAGSSFSAQLNFNEARAAGVIVVAAAGNEASSAPSYPAAYDGVISVSAVDTLKHLAPYSNYGSTVDITAPGGDTSVDRNGDGFLDGILSTLASGDASKGTLTFNYTLYQGTSMATPHVAGVAALMKAVKQNLTPADFDSLLSSGNITDDIGSSGRDDQFGYGLINAQKAVKAAGGTPTQDLPKLGVTPNGLNFAAGSTTQSLNLFNAGTGQLTVTSIQSDQPWLTVQETSVDAQKLGNYTATVDRSSLTDGIYNATLTITANSGATSIAVLMRVGGSTVSDTGLSYFQLINVATANAYQIAVLPDQGIYHLNFSDVAKGEYILLGGTDMDNDGFICAAGELCGGYPSTGQLTPIQISENVANLEFTANFSQSLQTGANLAAKLEPTLAGRITQSKGIARVSRSGNKTLKRNGLVNTAPTAD